MQDRIPRNPGRVLITPENGGAPYYATVTRADNAEREGTPINKAALLTDETAALFGFGSDAVPDDIFSLLSVRTTIETGTYKGTNTYGQNNPTQLPVGDHAVAVFVMGANAEGMVSYAYSGHWIKNGAFMQVETTSGNTSGNNFCKATYQNGILGWYDESYARNQLNLSGVTYSYLVISYNEGGQV